MAKQKKLLKVMKTTKKSERTKKTTKKGNIVTGIAKQVKTVRTERKKVAGMTDQQRLDRINTQLLAITRSKNKRGGMHGRSLSVLDPARLRGVANEDKLRKEGAKLAKRIMEKRRAKKSTTPVRKDR